MTANDILTPTIEERNVINDCFSHRGGDGYNESQLIPAMVYSMGKTIANADRGGQSFDAITFGLIASDQVNATAACHPAHGYVIGLNVGLIKQLFGAGYEMYPVSEDTQPIGTFWFALAYIATSFIIEHEVAHVSNGHLLLHLKQPEPLEMTMRHDDECSRKLSKLDIQTLEMDADACAVTRTIYWAVRLHRHAENGGRIAEGIHPFFKGFSETEVLTNVLSAMTLAIASLDLKDPELELCKQQSHLPRTARIFHAAALMEEVCKRLFDYSLSEQISIERHAEVINDVISKIDGEQPPRQDVLEFYLKPKEGYIHTLTKHWTSSLAPEIQRISTDSTASTLR